jgi:hypothetical protein
MALVWLVPPFGVILGHSAGRWLGLIAWIMLSISYVPTLQRFGRTWAWAPFLPLIASFFMAATIGAAVNHHLGRGVAWKGRDYQGSR